jgi:hypothetical protein
MQTVYQCVLSLVLIIGLSLLPIGWNPEIASAAPIIPNPNQLAQAVQEMESLDAMLSGLALTD